jgi:nitroimidazol reductase NimA-like FMN-containing flavoprotein (pyridoxamine 5'-phosphate oxidase superfamily)
MLSVFTAKEDEYLKGRNLCIICTVERSGDLHAVPIRYTYNGKAIFIPTHEKRKKIDNIRSNRKVSVLVTGFRNAQNQPEGLMIKGSAEILESGKEYLEAGDKIGIREQGFDEVKRVFTWGGYRQFIIKVTPKSKASWGINHSYRGSRTYAELGMTD